MNQNLLTLKICWVLYVKDYFGHRSKTFFQRGLRRCIQPEHRFVVMAVVLRVRDSQLRLADPTHTTKDKPPLLLRLVAWLQDLFHLVKLSTASDEKCRIDMRRLAKTDANGFPKAEVFLWLDNY
jgi:hypothetical protein